MTLLFDGKMSQRKHQNLWVATQCNKMLVGKQNSDIEELLLVNLP